MISIEGYEEETDRWRGEVVYTMIMYAFDYLREVKRTHAEEMAIQRKSMIPRSRANGSEAGNSGIFLTEDLFFIPTPERGGWELIQPREMEGMDHPARWEFYFYPKEEKGWLFLWIT